MVCCHVFYCSVYKSVRHHRSSKLEKLSNELLTVVDDYQAIMAMLMQRNAVKTTEISTCIDLLILVSYPVASGQANFVVLPLLLSFGHIELRALEPARYTVHN